jgi:hypothetical protein
VSRQRTDYCQQVNAANWHARLITVKNTAYAWRQMLFSLSFFENAGVAEFIAWAESHLTSPASRIPGSLSTRRQRIDCGVTGRDCGSI